MKKIYLVIGFSDDYVEVTKKGFVDIKKAEEYKAELESQESLLRDHSIRCRNCIDKCPLYSPPSYNDDYCESSVAYRNDIYYKIEEIDFEE